MKRGLLLGLWITLVQVVCAQSLTLYVHLDSSFRQSYTGRLYLLSQPDTTRGVTDPDPFNPAPVFYKDVKAWNASQVQRADDQVSGYPVAWNQLKAGWYKFAAILDINTEERVSTSTAGNLYSPHEVVVQVKPGTATEGHIYITNTFPPRTFKETNTVRLLDMPSKLLSEFHHKEVRVKAAVVLPDSYASNPDKIYPVVYIIPGWGGTHFDALQPRALDRYAVGQGKEKIYVYLNPETQTRWGLHAFVDSRVNGPWGKALVTEVADTLYARYRISHDRSQHFVTGQSSGGYGSLWLQLNYPEAFGGCWAVSPDPVDFSSYLGVNIYNKKANMYTDTDGKERGFFIVDGKPLATIRQFMQFEHFMGDGGQQQSFEAEFGLSDASGRPLPLVDVATGRVNQAVVNSWRPYDLGRFVEKQWKKKARQLNGKVNVFAGSDDNFLLQHPVSVFAAKAVKVKAVLRAELVPGANHWSIWSPAFAQQMQQWFDQRIN